MKKWLMRSLYAIFGIVVVMAVVGFGYEKLMRKQAYDLYPVQGKLVDISGRKLQIDCRGVGTPTLVLESGFDFLGSLAWSKVHDDLAKLTRTCAYSRAGVMWSEPSPLRFSIDTVASDLHALLGSANERGPIVLVGHSLGGPFIMKYTHEYGKDVKGLIFVDASHPDQNAKSKQVSHETGVAEPKESYPPYWIIRLVADTGILRLSDFVDVEKGLPEKDAAVAKAYAPQSLAMLREQAESLRGLAPSAGTLRQLGDRPVIFMHSTQPYTPSDAELAEMKMPRPQFQKFWARALVSKREMAAEQMNWSSNSRSINVDDAGHYIQLDNPAVVIKAVTDVVVSVRSGNRLDTDKARPAFKPFNRSE